MRCGSRLPGRMPSAPARQTSCECERRGHQAGRIINISSGASHLAMPEAIAYGASKSALDNFTLNLAKELGTRGITANSVAPGIIDTDANDGWLRGHPQAEAHAASLAALGRVGRLEDVADIVAFLASDDARWVTRKVIDSTGAPACEPPPSGGSTRR